MQTRTNDNDDDDSILFIPLKGSAELSHYDINHYDF